MNSFHVSGIIIQDISSFLMIFKEEKKIKVTIQLQRDPDQIHL